MRRGHQATPCRVGSGHSSRWRRGLLALAWVACGALGACQHVEQVSETLENKLAPRDLSPPPVIVQSEPELRVRVLKGAREATVAGPARLVVRAYQGANPVSLPTPLKITCDARGIVIQDARGERRAWNFGVDLEILAADARAGGATLTTSRSIELNGVSYAGVVAIRPRWQEYPDTFDAVVSMGVESYLPGVVVREMPGEAPRQAQEVQAVAARSYLLQERERSLRDGRQFDVELLGAPGEGGTSGALEAVRATRGMVLTYRGRVLRAYYSSTCGGRAASAGDVWPSGAGFEFNRVPPLQGATRRSACEGSPHYRWEVERRDEELGQRLRAWGRLNNAEIARLGRVKSVLPEDLNAARRPGRYRVTDDAAREYTLGAEDFRSACNQSVATLAPIDDATRVRSGDVDVELWAGIVRIHGRGLGHGVGLCQQCARGLALQGLDWRDMAREFFPGADVAKMY